ncbi:iron-sulfur cluster assembly accessory protein [Planococcus shenhongbingii]|uniref:Iron-sulfur cluster assembly accessory protein n=1 Tax=Planococcus shenhongbingii TaxID=3058398 RepID=A0ABT8NHB0_9BACL|nr:MULTISPECIES: iron-sulfur cluster assembly accessory protein [unclassified Planococcus (in: firmicutes)]MDN7247221.1 iron-sulfur cluster assembly accessory protein [Planococcus sp. N017]WKA59755.1 iron-sulfur cluster assembly accessory protein [Planococcus sp. N016]
MTQVVEITEAASVQVKEMMRHNEEEDSFLRVAVKGGGCSGLTYGMAFEKEQGSGDDLLEQFGIRILVAREDAPILKGTIVDYKQSLMGGGFTIENPNAIASCGCGTSFRTAQKAGTPENC